MERTFNGAFRANMTRELLKTTLAAAVPFHIAELMTFPFDQVMEEARAHSQTVAEKGDVIMFKSKRKGETAAAFNALARGVACCSFMPGGITFLGDHWECKHPALECCE